LLGILDEPGIGRAVWSYKNLDFGLVDAGGNLADAALIDILRRDER